MSENDINKILAELKEKFSTLLNDHLVKFVLFGSRARGDYDETSDIDVAVVVSGLTKELKERIFDETTELELKHLTPVSIIVLSEDDFIRLKNRERRLALDIEKEGMAL